MKISTHCPNGCRHKFSRVAMPDGRHDRLLCDQCGKEVIVKMPIAMCKCGSRDFIVRPKAGHAMEDGYMMQCAKCNEYVTIDYLLAAAESETGRKRKIKKILPLFILLVVIAFLIWIILIFIKN